MVFGHKNFLPPLTNQLSLYQGGSVTLNSSNLAIDDQPYPVFYQIIDVEHGHFESFLQPNAPISYFSSDNITDGHIRFLHDNSTTAPRYSVIPQGSVLLRQAPLPANITFSLAPPADSRVALYLSIVSGLLLLLMGLSFWAYRYYRQAKRQKVDGVIAPNQSTLEDATGEEMAKMVEYYQFNPVPGFDIKSVKKIVNPQFEQQFTMAKEGLEKRHGNSNFTADWPQLPEGSYEKFWRQRNYEFFTELAKPNHDPDYPHVQIIPLWHGTAKEALRSMLETGVAILKTTDEGFYEPGVYGTTDAEYAWRVYAQQGQGVLLINLYATYLVYPLIDKKEVRTKPGRYDATFILVSARDPLKTNEVNYDPCKIGMLHDYTEFVVKESKYCLLRYKVELQPTFPANIKKTPEQQIYEVGEHCEKTGQPLVAYYYYTKAKKYGEARADNKINQLEQSHPQFKNSLLCPPPVQKPLSQQSQYGTIN